ncbi:protein-tyrosine phosphatase-like protein [Spinellus fusiger]|nr:protein-tyrosine phosphatase-like protein [Spinellus fusiger]KAI7869213.1 protein-tyrosine phosphatase-like protein [Spinellus fusiger]
MGVSVMYKQLTLHCKSEIRHSLDVFTDPKNYPIHIHCSHGKDRTGILACLVQSIAGVPEEIIVRDYARTQKELEPVRDILLKEIRDSGFSDEFAETPPKNMEYLLHHFNSTYGSVDGYLDSVGFDEECREKVRKIICVE